MKLRDLLPALSDYRVLGDDGVDVRTIKSDSREIEKGDVFVAVRGIRSDGHAFLQVAIERGASVVVVEEEPSAAVATKVAVVVVPSGAVALGKLIARSLGDPAKKLTLIGITGTNGKTTTTYLVESILVAAGHKPGVIGTVTYRWGGQSMEAPYTTPTPQVLHETFAKMLAAGCTHVVMEVSSAALAMDRLAGVEFAVAGFSNLTQDHLDVHGTMANYLAAKRRLFSDHLSGLNGTAVVNVDDPKGQHMGAAADGRVLRVTAKGRGDGNIRVVRHEDTVRGITARIATPRGELTVESKPLIGHYNVENIALAVGIGEALGLPHAAIAKGIAALPGVPGRVERVANNADLDILVDYAHTPDALRNVLEAVRPLTKRRLICVFGCGGDRDPTKRPKMGAAVAELADLAVVTSDNPRTEDPRAILEQILPGVPKPFLVEVDRKLAIRAAIAEAVPGDVVVIAGKGHEDYQIIGTTKHHFDDREQAAEAVTQREHRLVVGLARDAGGSIEASRSGDADTTQIDRVVIDSRKALPGSLYVAIKGHTHDGHAFAQAAVDNGAVAVVVDRKLEVAVPQIIVEDTTIGLGKIARAHRRAWTGKLVAITGSAGKTTTKELTRAALAFEASTHAAEGSLNNETGVPLTLLGLRLFHTYGVIEMGMRGLGQIEYLTKLAEPDVAVVVNAGTAHIELLGSTDAIAQAKGEIWRGLRDGGTVVRPADDARLERHARAHRPDARHVTFGDKSGDVHLVEYTPLDAGGQLVLDVFGTRHDVTLHLVGKHAAIDACAAIAAAHAAGASVANILAGLAKARPPAMRGEIVEVAGRKVIVDCYNANPASMAAALRTLAERAKGAQALAVVGDMLELGDHTAKEHTAVGALAQELGLSVIALGDQAATVAAAAGKKAQVAADPAVAAKRAFECTTTGDWILLKASRGMKLERVLEAMKELR
ncbi:MAG: UDP-N-acetylmuramoyl-L-alanyl-D-glutamate--2,6-diaminopimelate ligase [Kofleriaceae bacterium]|nr:UDP-N-acetylmuramoyl-L-alanyl-D-glutamate--2,6-diaminopimelate ligase [Kofleriaceae bacterium]